MSAGNDLRALLAGDAGVSALVGTRISADRMDQGKARPFVIYEQTEVEHFRGLDNTLHASKYVFSVQVWADTRISATQTAEAVADAINASDNAEVVNEGSAYDGDLDLEASILTVEWWDD